MAILSAAKLRALLLNTGLQQKDPSLYQVIYDLIGVVTALQVATGGSSGGGGGSGTITINRTIQQLIEFGSSDNNSDGDSYRSDSFLQNIVTEFTKGSIIFVGDSGILTEDNVNFFWDNVNKRLGIGVNTPGNPLVVQAETGGNAADFIGRDNTGIDECFIVFYKFDYTTVHGAILAQSDSLNLCGPSETPVLIIIDTLVTIVTPLSVEEISLPNTGAAPTTGQATLVGGTVTVNTTAMTATSLLFLQRKTAIGTISDLTYTQINGTSFTINSVNPLDASVVNWWIVDTH